jgi:hypothetical protein
VNTSNRTTSHARCNKGGWTFPSPGVTPSTQRHARAAIPDVIRRRFGGQYTLGVRHDSCRYPASGCLKPTLRGS